MKSVLISIQPKWCELIASGKKTVEVRKTRPKLETPFKVYIYQTKRTWTYDIYSRIANSQSKVIGEFVCDEIYADAHFNATTRVLLDNACLTLMDIARYVKPKQTAYFWHISDLVIYDEPRELGKFKRVCDGNCQSCQYAIWQTNGWAYEPYIVDCKPITRPPQSWCYVEGVGA